MTDWTTGLLLCSIWKWTKVFDGSDRPGISYSCSKHALLSDTFLAVRLLSAVRPQRQTSELTGKSGRMWGHKSAQDEHVHSELEEKRARNFKQWMGGGLKPLHCCNICDWWDWSGSQDIQQITRDLHDPPALPTVMVRLLDGSAVWLLGPSALPLAVRWVSCVFWPLMVNGITSTSARPSGARLPGLITITQQAHPRPLYTLTFPAHWFATHTHTHTQVCTWTPSTSTNRGLQPAWEKTDKHLGEAGSCTTVGSYRREEGRALDPADRVIHVRYQLYPK